jgi:AcrR family transcriptional regulator
MAEGKRPAPASRRPTKVAAATVRKSTSASGSRAAATAARRLAAAEAAAPDQGVPSGARRAEILRTAAQVFATKGYSSSTVRDIGDESGILSGSLYYHFTSKEQMLEEILDSVLDSILAGYREIRDSDPDPVEGVTQLISVALHFVADDPNGAMIMQNDFTYIRRSERFAVVSEKYSEIREIWLTVLEKAVKSRLIRRDVDLAIAYRMMMGSILSTVRWFSPNGTHSIDAIAKQHASIFLDGMSPRIAKK